MNRVKRTLQKRDLRQRIDAGQTQMTMVPSYIKGERVRNTRGDFIVGIFSDDSSVRVNGKDLYKSRRKLWYGR